jgi:surfeit locus 1 family protein
MSEADYRTRSPESWAVSGAVEVGGLLLPSQPEPAIAVLADRVPAEGEPPLREWRALSIEGIRRQIPYPVLGVYLAQESPAPGPAGPQPSAELDLTEGPHLGYAIQWFAFAAIAIVGGLLWLRRAHRPGRT